MDPSPEPAAGTPASPWRKPSLKDPIRNILEKRLPWAIDDSTFSHQCLGVGPMPDQGWKLHVSATPFSAVKVLSAVLDILLTAGLRFKVVNSMVFLGQLNSGDFGISQIGKFITVYPSSDDDAVRIALELDEATRGCLGPRVPSDRPLRPGSLIHYRYGAMRLRSEVSSAGESASGAFELLDAAGRLTDDLRLSFYVPPDVPDPFAIAGTYVPRPTREALLNGRYLVTDALSQSPRGGVFRAVDMGFTPVRVCLLKEFWHDVSTDEYGRDARDMAQNEERILVRHADDKHFPNFIESFEFDGNRYNAIEYVEGTALDRLRLQESHSTVPVAQVVEIGLATADALAHLHSLGVVFRDLKPGNVVRTAEGSYRLIDFGIAFESSDSQPPFGAGTPEFCSPEQYGGQVPTSADDIFAWGALLHYLACGKASPDDSATLVPDEHPFRRAPVGEMNAGIPSNIAAVIDRAVAWRPEARYATIAEARAALTFAARSLKRLVAIGSSHRRQPSDEPDSETFPPAQLTSSDALRKACEVGDALVSASTEVGGGVCWDTRAGSSDQLQRNPDLYSGAAGIGLFLAELASATGEERYAVAARAAARWLGGPIWGRGVAQHGLHGGEPGVAYFFLRLADLLDEPGYVDAANLRMRRLRGSPHRTVDLMHGTAGTILTLLRLHKATGESGYLSDAHAAGEDLVLAAQRPPAMVKGYYWEVPAAEPGGPVAPYLGLLHGAAGIGLAMAELAATTGNERFLSLAVGAADLLLSQARSYPVARSVGGRARHDGLAWPRQLGDNALDIQAHCHGAAGIAQFLLRLNQLSPEKRLRRAAERAALTVASHCRIERFSGLCHGLSGIGNALLDCFQILGDTDWLLLARGCGGLLQTFEHGSSTGLYCLEKGGRVSSDLMNGSAGIGIFLLRLANPATVRESILG